MSFSGGGGASSSASDPMALTLNPATLILGSALGLPSRVTKKGGLTFSNKGGNTGFPQGSIDPAQAFAPLANLFQPRGGNVITGTDLVPAFGQQGLFGAGQAINLFNNSLLPAANDLVNTGFKTDIQPAIAQAQSRFRNDFLPDAIEQFGLLGLDAGDSDFGSAVAREAGRISTELGAMDVGLSEAAAQRRMGGIPLAAELAQGSAALPLTLANDLFGFEAASRGAEFAASPEGQIFNLLAQISGMPTQSHLGQSSHSNSFDFGFRGDLGGGGGGGLSGLKGTSAGASSGGATSAGGLGALGLMGMGICHVAARYFGWFTPDWFAAREWITTGWPRESAVGAAFLNFYRRTSAHLAALADQSPELDATLRNIFEYARDRGSRG